MSESILEEALRLTTGARNEDYGHPLQDFSRTAALWSAVLGCPVTAEQVGLCMICLKVSRECHRPKRDNRTDMAGYANTLQMIADKREAGEVATVQADSVPMSRYVAACGADERDAMDEARHSGQLKVSER